MIDQTRDSTDIDILTRRLQNAEKSINFLQNEHAATLNQLHDELAKWQEKYSDLSFRLSIDSQTVPSKDDRQLRTTKERHENELRQSKETITALKQQIEDKENLLKDYEKRLSVLNQQYALELHAQNSKQRELQKELDQRAITIAKLTDQLQREKEHQQAITKRTALGQAILPDKPTKLKCHDESPRPPQQQQQQSQRNPQPHRSLSNRSSSLNIRDPREQETVEVLLLRRRPPTPPQQLRSPSMISVASNNDLLNTSRQRQPLTTPLGHANAQNPNPSRLETKLPPIAIRKMPLRASPGSFIQQKTDI